MKRLTKLQAILVLVRGRILMLSKNIVFIYFKLSLFTQRWLPVCTTTLNTHKLKERNGKSMASFQHFCFFQKKAICNFAPIAWRRVGLKRVWLKCKKTTEKGWKYTGFIYEHMVTDTSIGIHFWWSAHVLILCANSCNRYRANKQGNRDHKWPVDGSTSKLPTKTKAERDCKPRPRYQEEVQKFGKKYSESATSSTLKRKCQIIILMLWK